MKTRLRRAPLATLGGRWRGPRRPARPLGMTNLPDGGPRRAARARERERVAPRVEEARDRLEQVRADRAVRDRGDRRVRRAHPVEDRERLAVPVGRGRRGELEHRWGGERDAGGGRCERG